MATQKQLEALQLWRLAEGKSEVVGGPRPTRRQVERAQITFAESIAYGDLPTQLQPAIIRSLRHYYAEVPQVTESFTRLWELQGIDVSEEYDIYAFNQDNIPATNDGRSFIPGMLPAVGRRESYPQLGLEGSGKFGKVGKYGEAFGIDWETIVNTRGRNVNLLRDAIAKFGRDSANTNEAVVGMLLVDSSGFRVGAGEELNGAHHITGNPDMLDPLDLATAIGELLNVTVEGEEVQPSKFVVLASVSHAPKIRQTIGNRRIVRNPGVESGYSWEETVDYGAEVEVVAFPWLKKLYASIGAGTLIIPVPSESELPVLTRNRLAGYPEPSFWVKDSNAKSANGGGDIDAEAEGDFDSDSVVSKVRHVTGASALWVEQIGYSTGANSE